MAENDANKNTFGSKPKKRQLALLPVRRSKRLKTESDHYNQLETANVSKNFSTVSSSAKGYFDSLPVEQLHQIFNYLNYLDLSVLTLCSKVMRNTVDGYIKTNPAVKRLPDTQKIVVQGKETNDQDFRCLAFYIKRSTCLYPTKERLVIMFTYLKKMSLSRLTYNLVNFHQILISLGNLLHTFIAGWDYSECYLVENMLNKMWNVKEMTNNIIKQPPGAKPLEEAYIRSYYNLVYIRTVKANCDQAFWLSRALKLHPIVHQAKLIYILFGPMFDEYSIDWNFVTSDANDDIFQDQSFFREMGICIILLDKHSKEWNDDDIISIIQELIHIPFGWTVVNIAHLLLVCGRSIARIYLANKIVNGKVNEVAVMIVHMVLVCSRHKLKLECVEELARNLMNHLAGYGLYIAILDAFKNLSDILRYGAIQDPSRTHDYAKYEVFKASFISCLVVNVVEGNVTEE